MPRPWLLWQPPMGTGPVEFRELETDNELYALSNGPVDTLPNAASGRKKYKTNINSLMQRPVYYSLMIIYTQPTPPLGLFCEDYLPRHVLRGKSWSAGSCRFTADMHCGLSVVT